MEVISAQTTAATGLFNIKRGPGQIAAGPLGTGETVSVQLWDGTAYEQAYDSTGTAIVLTPARPNWTLGPGDYQASKSATAAAATVVFYQNDF